MRRAATRADRSEEAPLDVVLPNGLRVVAARLPASAALSAELRWPAGTVGDPVGRVGAGAVLVEWLQRGVDGSDAEAFAAALERLGARLDGGAGRETGSLHVGCRMAEASRVLPLAAAAAARPTLADDEFDGARGVVLEALEAAADDPGERLSAALVAARYRGAHARGPLGRRGDLRRLTAPAVRELHATWTPVGAVLAVAAGGDPERWVDVAAASFGGWQGPAARRQADATVAAPRRRHHRFGGHQTHVAVVEDAIAPHDPRWTAQAVAVVALSGVGGARLWTELRERRGLAYDVDAYVRLQGGDAALVTRAATGARRAGETLALLRSELARWRAGLLPDELARAKRVLATRWVLESESGDGRAARLASDVLRFGRPRGVAEVLAALQEVTLEDVGAALAAAGRDEPTVVTLGPIAPEDAQ